MKYLPPYLKAAQTGYGQAAQSSADMLRMMMMLQAMRQNDQQPKFEPQITMTPHNVVNQTVQPNVQIQGQTQGQEEQQSDISPTPGAGAGPAGPFPAQMPRPAVPNPPMGQPPAPRMNQPQQAQPQQAQQQQAQPQQNPQPPKAPNPLPPGGSGIQNLPLKKKSIYSVYMLPHLKMAQQPNYGQMASSAASEEKKRLQQQQQMQQGSPPTPVAPNPELMQSASRHVRSPIQRTQAPRPQVAGLSSVQVATPVISAGPSGTQAQQPVPQPEQEKSPGEIEQERLAQAESQAQTTQPAQQQAQTQPVQQQAQPKQAPAHEQPVFDQMGLTDQQGQLYQFMKPEEYEFWLSSIQARTQIPEYMIRDPEMRRRYKIQQIQQRKMMRAMERAARSGLLGEGARQYYLNQDREDYEDRLRNYQLQMQHNPQIQQYASQYQRVADYMYGKGTYEDEAEKLREMGWSEDQIQQYLQTEKTMRGYNRMRAQAAGLQRVLSDISRRDPRAPIGDLVEKFTTPEGLATATPEEIHRLSSILSAYGYDGERYTRDLMNIAQANQAQKSASYRPRRYQFRKRAQGGTTDPNPKPKVPPKPPQQPQQPQQPAQQQSKIQVGITYRSPFLLESKGMEDPRRSQQYGVRPPTIKTRPISQKVRQYWGESDPYTGRYFLNPFMDPTRGKFREYTFRNIHHGWWDTYNRVLPNITNIAQQVQNKPQEQLNLIARLKLLRLYTPEDSPEAEQLNQRIEQAKQELDRLASSGLVDTNTAAMLRNALEQPDPFSVVTKDEYPAARNFAMSCAANPQECNMFMGDLVNTNPGQAAIRYRYLKAMGADDLIVSDVRKQLERLYKYYNMPEPSYRTGQIETERYTDVLAFRKALGMDPNVMQKVQEIQDYEMGQLSRNLEDPNSLAEEISRAYELYQRSGGKNNQGIAEIKRRLFMAKMTNPEAFQKLIQQSGTAIRGILGEEFYDLLTAEGNESVIPEDEQGVADHFTRVCASDPVSCSAVMRSMINQKNPEAERYYRYLKANGMVGLLSPDVRDAMSGVEQKIQQEIQTRQQTEEQRKAQEEARRRAEEEARRRAEEERRRMEAERRRYVASTLMPDVYSTLYGPSNVIEEAMQPFRIGGISQYDWTRRVAPMFQYLYRRNPLLAQAFLQSLMAQTQFSANRPWL